MRSQINGVFPGQSQVVGQSTAAAIPVQPITRSIQTGISTGVGVGLGIGEIVIRVICTVFCIGVLIPAAVAISAVNSVEDSFEQLGNGSEYENASSYRSAAIYLVWISSLAMVFHILMIIVRILYMTSVMKKLFRIHVLLNGILSVLFALSLLAGAIVSIIYASENGGLWRDLCLLSINFDFDECSSLQSVVATEAASGVFSFLSMILFGVLCLIMICNYCVAKSEEPKQSHTYITQPQVVQSQKIESTNVPLHPTSMSPHPTSMSPHPTSVSPHPTSVSPHRTSVSTSLPPYPTETPQYVTPTAPSSSILRGNLSQYLPSSGPQHSPTNTLQYASPSAPSSSLLRGTTSRLSSFSQSRSPTNTLQDSPPSSLPHLSTNISSYVSPSAPPSQPVNVSIYRSAQAPPYESTVTPEYNPQYVSLREIHDESKTTVS